MANALSRNYNILEFGADPTATVDSTTAITNALTAATNGGGKVLVPNGNFLCNGNLSIPSGVTLAGTTEGPFVPVIGSVQPTLYVTSTSATFISLGDRCGVTDIAFYYPNQVAPTSSTPTVYPATITVNGGAGNFIRRCTAINAYDFIYCNNARTYITDCFIGGLRSGIIVDHALDYVYIDRIMFQIMWDIYVGPLFSNLSTWVINNGYGMIIYRADAIKVSNIGSFWRYCHISLADSPDTGLSPRCGYGNFTNLDLDTCAYGIIASSTGSEGYIFNNLHVGSGGGVASTTSVIYLPSGGTGTPNITIEGGAIRGSWISTWNVVTGNLYVSNIRGDPRGDWTVYSPSMTPTAGSFTAVSTGTSSYVRHNNTVTVSVIATITTVGTGSGGLLITLPIAPRVETILVGREIANTGLTITGSCPAASTTMTVLTYANANPVFSNGCTYVFTGTYPV